MAAATKGITYTHEGEWSGYTLQQREDGLWRYDCHSQVQGCTTGRVTIIEAPEGLGILDEADLDTAYTKGQHSKADYLIAMGREVRCLRRGYPVR